jgi:hypothetical protein
VLEETLDTAIALPRRTPAHRVYRPALGVDGADLPAHCGEVIEGVMTFADPLVRPDSDARWHAAGRRCTAT